VKTNPKFLLSILISTILISNTVLAQPGIPNAFYGSVTWNGSPAPDGTTVTAKINGVEVASTTTKNGKYGIDPVFYVDDPDHNRSGKEVRFFVNGVDTGQFKYFSNGAVTLLNLIASGGTGGQQQQGGGGGGGGGGGIPSVTQQNQTAGTTSGTQQECQERWICSDWSTCQNGIKTRTCNDENNCGTRNNEPFTSQPCSKEEREEAEQKSQPLSITAFFLALTTFEWATAIVAGIIIAIVIIFLFKKRGSKKK
jgi:hypothetical protein